MMRFVAPLVVVGIGLLLLIAPVSDHHGRGDAEGHESGERRGWRLGVESFSHGRHHEHHYLQMTVDAQVK